MRRNLNSTYLLWLIVLLMASCQNTTKIAKQDILEEKILSTDNIIAFWNFEKDRKELFSKGKISKELLIGRDTSMEIIKQGPISGYSVYLKDSNYLYIPYSETGLLNIQTNEVTVMAWVNWSGEKTGFVAGMWNEFEEEGRRQYGLFLSLPYYNGKNQVCGHISKSGKATPPFPYSIDYSASFQTIEPKKWNCVAFTYDGKFIKSYLNGKFKVRPEELIDHTIGFDGYSDGLYQSKNPYYFPFGIGDNGSDFTIGAVRLNGGMGNFFHGLIGGVAIFNRALSAGEINKLSKF